jgi:DNA-binding SARP family transcriptional activator
MPKLDSIVRHAITAPAFDQTKLHRERLVDEIHANVPRKLVALVAPPGYGKTTLLADFTEHTDLPVCWVRLSEADRDVYRLAGMLSASLGRRFRRLQKEIELDNLAGSTPEALGRIFAEVIDTRVSETFVIILDDVHLINSSEQARAFLDEFLTQLPEQVTVIAAGREVVDVSLARLMADGDLGGIGPPDLAMTQEEIIALADLQAGFELNEDQAGRLLDETKGWITGLLLSAELASGDLPSLVFDARPMVYEYLASVVLNRQPEDMRRFLLDSSVFPVMTVEGCNEVLKRDDSQRFLTRLVRSGLFVSATNDTPRTYEYHPQFREFLLESLASADSKHLQALRKRAAAYLARHDLPEQAVDLYLEADQAGQAAIVAEVHVEKFFHQGRIGTLEHWQKQLAGESITQLTLFLTQAYCDQGNIPLAEEMYTNASKLAPKASIKNHAIRYELVGGNLGKLKNDPKAVSKAVSRCEALISNRTSKVLRAALLRLKGWIAFTADKDYELAEEYFISAVELLENSGSMYPLVGALQDLLRHQIAQGQTMEANATGQKAHAIELALGSPLHLAISFNNLGLQAHLGSQYQNALELYNEGLMNARRAATRFHEALILLGQADVFSDLNLALQAAELYGQGLMLATEIDNVWLIRYGCLQTSVLHRRRGSRALAKDWLARAISVGGAESPPPEVQIQLSALEIPSRPEYAARVLRETLKSAGLEANQAALAKLLLGKASLTGGDLPAAQAELEDALAFAGANGMEQVLVGELAFDEELREYMRSHLQGYPTLSVILRRIDSMRAIAQQYQMADENEGSPDIIRFQALGKGDVINALSDSNELKPLAREVLFFLVDRGSVERDVLLETFWPHYPPGRQVANLHTAIYSLRRLLGKEAIEHEGLAYTITSEAKIEYDVQRFERAAQVASGLPPGDPRRMFALTEAINSYAGTFLPEFDSEWVVERRRELELRYLDLLGEHAQEALVRDQPDRALRTLRQALDLDPLRDDTNLRYLEALGRLGRRSELVEHYQNYSRLLSNELGLDPPEPMRELYARLIG